MTATYSIRRAGPDGVTVADHYDDPLLALDHAKRLAADNERAYWVWRDDGSLIGECGGSGSRRRERYLNDVNGAPCQRRSIDRAREFRARREHCDATDTGLHDWRGTGAEYRCTACGVIGRHQLERVVERRCQAPGCDELATHHYVPPTGWCKRYVACETHRGGWGKKRSAA